MLNTDVIVTKNNAGFRLIATQSFKDQVHCHSIVEVVEAVEAVEAVVALHVTA